MAKKWQGKKLTQANAFDFRMEAAKFFTPGAPIKTASLFAGRKQPVRRVLNSITAAGRHPIIFGQRGVGKTSLANVLDDHFNESFGSKVSCDSSDCFGTIWEKQFRRMSATVKELAFGFTHQQISDGVSLADELPSVEEVTPNDITTLLSRTPCYCVFIFDEYDRIDDVGTQTYMADLIKQVSDELAHVTIVVVGVAESVAELISEHASIVRNLVEIEIPKMTNSEIEEIVNLGFGALGIEVPKWLTRLVVLLSNGFPHYAHLIGLCIAEAMVRQGKATITEDTVGVACDIAIEDSIQSLRDGFSEAVATMQPSRYPRILVGCGYAHHNEREVFRATDVVSALNKLFPSEGFTIQSVAPVLQKFTEPERAQVLEPVKIGNRNHYRFRDPMMRPFLMIKGRTLLAQSKGQDDAS